MSGAMSWADSERASQIATAVVVGIFALALLGQVLLLRQRNQRIAVGPVFVVAALCLLGLYGLGSLIDLLADLAADGPRSPHESLVERLLLGRFDRSGQLLPLRARPLLAAPIHAAGALALYLALVPLCWWLGRCSELDAEGADPVWDDRPLWRRVFVLCGHGELAPPPRMKRRLWRTLEPRFAAWIQPLLLAAPLLLFAAFWELFRRDPTTPPLPSFLWAVCSAVFAAALVNRLGARAPEPASAATPPPVEPPAPSVDPLAWIEALQQRGFVVSATAAHTVAPPPRSAPVATEPDGAAPPAAGASAPAAPARPGSALAAAGPLDELQRLLTGGGALWAHQREALCRLLDGGEHVLLATAPRSGRTAVAQLLCAQIAVVGGQNALVVLRDEQTARDACRGLAEQLVRTSWRENLRCTLAGPELLRLLSQQRSPVIAFAHPDTLDRIVAAHRDHRYFLEHLGLVVFEDLERHGGVRGAHLHFIVHRLLAVLAELRAAPRLLATLGLLVRDFERYAETLLGMDLRLVANDDAPAVPVALHPAGPPAQAPLPPAAIATAEAVALGLPTALSGFADVTHTELDRAAALVSTPHGKLEPVSPERARVSVAELSGAGLTRLLSLLPHAGSQVAGRDRPQEHRMLLLPAHDALSRWLAQQPQRALSPLLGRRRLVAEPRSGLVARQHLRRCLLEIAPDEAWARRVFGDDPIDELLRAGSLVRRRRNELRGDPPRLTPVCRLGLEADVGPVALAGGSVDAVGPRPLSVVDRATGQVLRRLDPTRAPLLAHPGAVLLFRGRRFAIGVDEQPRYEPEARIDADLCEEELRSVRVRSLAVRLGDSADRALRPLSLGGVTVEGGLMPVEATEEIVGVRRYRRGAARFTASTFGPIRTRYRSEAWVLALGAQAADSEPAVHALVHLLRAVIESQLDCGEEGLHLAHSADLEGRGPALLLLDTHEGGAGYARAVDLTLLESCLRLVQRVLADRCCDGSGCVRCVRTVHCHQADPDDAALDRAGAQALVARLLGEP